MSQQQMNDGRYDSIADFLDSLRPEVIRNKANLDTLKDWAETGQRGNTYGNNWYGAGCKTGADVQRLMRQGWSDGIAKIDKLRDDLSHVEMVPITRKRKMIRTDAGDELNMAHVYQGRLDTAWTTTRRQVTRGPQKIDLCVNMICSGAEDADVLFWRGAAAAVLADLLETSGYMVRLVVGFGGQHDTGRVSCRITVKDYGMPLDISATSATILPGFFRALGHAWVPATSTKRVNNPGMYVKEVDYEAGELKLSHNVRDRNSAIAFVNKTIADLNQQVAA